MEDYKNEMKAKVESWNAGSGESDLQVIYRSSMGTRDDSKAALDPVENSFKQLEESLQNRLAKASPKVSPKEVECRGDQDMKEESDNSSWDMCSSAHRSEDQDIKDHESDNEAGIESKEEYSESLKTSPDEVEQKKPSVEPTSDIVQTKDDIKLDDQEKRSKEVKVNCEIKTEPENGESKVEPLIKDINKTLKEVNEQLTQIGDIFEGKVKDDSDTEGVVVQPRPCSSKPKKPKDSWQRMDEEAKKSANFIPKEDKKKTRGSSGMKWEDQMVNMVQELNKGLDKNSSEYKKRKKKLLKERREFIELKKMELLGKADPTKSGKVDGSTSPQFGMKKTFSANFSPQTDCMVTTGTSPCSPPKYLCSGTNTDDLDQQEKLQTSTATMAYPFPTKNLSDEEIPMLEECSGKTRASFTTSTSCNFVRFSSQTEIEILSSSSSEESKSSKSDDEEDETTKQKDNIEGLMLKSLRAFVEADYYSNQSSQEKSVAEKMKERLEHFSSDDEDGSDFDYAPRGTNMYNLRATIREIEHDEGSDNMESQADELIGVLKALPKGSSTVATLEQLEEISNPLDELNKDLERNLKIEEARESLIKYAEKTPVEKEEELRKMQEKFQYHATKLDYFDDEEDDDQIERELDRTTKMFESYLKAQEDASKQTKQNFQLMMDQSELQVESPKESPKDESPKDDEIEQPESLFGRVRPKRKSLKKRNEKSPRLGRGGSSDDDSSPDNSSSRQFRVASTERKDKPQTEIKDVSYKPLIEVLDDGDEKDKF